MAHLGTVNRRDVETGVYANYDISVSPLSAGAVNTVVLSDVDYAYLAGMVGQGIVAATGGEPVEVTATGPSGAFDTQKIATIIGQQIAAAVSAPA